MAPALAVLVLAFSQLAPKAALERYRYAIASGSEDRIHSIFAKPEGSAYLFDMAKRLGGWNKLKVAVIPAPPGWDGPGSYWAVIHAAQQIESDHDVVYRMVQGDAGLVLGEEIAEDASCLDAKITDGRATAHIVPATHTVDVLANLLIEGAGKRALLLRLNDTYVLRSAGGHGPVITADDDIPSPHRGDVVRAGGLLIPWVDSVPSELNLLYRGVIPAGLEDRLDEKACYLTAYWFPSLGRLPFPFSAHIIGPANWILRSEGVQTVLGHGGPFPAADNEQDTAYRCEIPISFPKIVCGPFKLAGERTVGGKTFRSYQLDPVQPERAQHDLDEMASAMADFEPMLGPFPFSGYECFDGAEYYGIESYSYTVLRRDVTTRFVSHEMGHTYFGGLTPCAYVHDTWNEGLTTYIDSVVHLRNKDHSLEAGLRTIKTPIPLNRMNIAWANGSATYYRGAYAMNMLADEIGLDKQLSALRRIVADRRGRDTRWDDLRPYFEQEAGRTLDWFWRQWIDGAQFPALKVTDVEPINREGHYQTRVTVAQTGTAQPYRMKFKIWVRDGGLRVEKLVETHAPIETFTLEGDFAPREAGLDVFPFTLADSCAPVSVPRAN
ncbi:MAG: hypothetical protein HYR64_01005 [Fimbriimonas ginsengisoli]|uniref:Peptidase M1 membrane alanine aminopeptidase domain-containing protein n=1 Tax=Fimbriimonas ginsengisoli TaxID=1005039 RepID=A0A931PUY4_FIMGI|nr:hypothetical protein [Fimbriimonas ginsengisoli]